ncbi:MAG TPA: adenylate/guanylate cyclase domain-containing protein [Gaiellaceae bacterium]|nr:adenylate/guanylate cyclase domain-containing protein [Gaiellaceae bacterium]
MDDLPRGAVTFLFTDVEGSTRLVKQLRDEYGDVLAAHQRLLREAFAQHGGHEIDTQGDAFFVAFASAREAVLAAVEGQRALAGYPWPNGASVKVRMGIHTGQAAPVDGRYTGLAVHRAARICAAGHGGQVLVSQATQTLLEDEEEDLAVSLDDLGAQRLKDLDRPVQLYQVAGPGLETDFPPIRGEDEPDAAVGPPVPTHRRPLVLGLAVLAVLAAAVLAFMLLRGGGGGGLSGVKPNNVGVIDPTSNDIVDALPVGLRPGPIALKNGVVWVGNLGDRSLTRITAETRAFAATVPLDPRTPTGIAVGEGGVWVAHGFLGSLSLVDPRFNRRTDTVDLAGPSPGFGAVTVGRGSAWAVFGDSTLARIAPADIQRHETGFAGGSPSGVVYAQGSLWVTNSADSTVSRFDPRTFQEGPVARDTSVGKRPVAIAFGEGALWTANAGDGTVTRIDPDTRSTSTIPVGGEPAGVAAGDGAVWVAEADGTVVRIDPTKGVVKRISLGNPAAGIALGAGLVWVTVEAP